MNTQDLQNLYGRALQNEERGVRQLKLTDKEIEQGAINAAIQTMSDRGFNQVPTYKGSIVLPEITITPNDSYIYDPSLNAKLRRRLCYGGRLGL